MPTEYSYSSAPQPIKPAKKYRNEEEGVTLTMMSDPRVVRGSTLANARQMSLAEKVVKKKTFEPAQKIHSIPEATRGTYSFEVKPFSNTEIDLTQYLVEPETKIKTVREVDSQTEAFKPRPVTPPYIPRKTGIDNFTQVEDVNELFDFDAEVGPLLNVIVQKTLEQALFEVKSEMEILKLQGQIKVFNDTKAEEEAWVTLKEKETIEELKSKRDAVLQLEKENNEKDKINKTVAGLQAMQQLVPAMFEEIAEQCFSNGTWKRSHQLSVKETFLNPLCKTVDRQLDALFAARLLAEELIAEANTKYENFPKARPWKAPSVHLTIHFQASNLIRVGGEVAEEESGIKDVTVGPLLIQADQTILDIIAMVQDELKKLSLTSNTDLRGHFKTVLNERDIASDAPLLNFPVPENISLVV